jgi:hypothetical protein
MRTNRTNWWIASLTTLLLPVSAAFAAEPGNLVVNGGFESPALGHGSWNVFHSIAGWTTQSGCGIEVQNRVAGSPLEGAQHVELDSHCPTTMFQDIPTQAGRSYLFSFGYSPRPGVYDNRIRVFWEGRLVADLNANGTGLGETRWQHVTVQVEASGASTRLIFADSSAHDSVGGYIDAVSVVAATRQVQLVVKPGDGAGPKPINLKSNGVIPVAILSTSGFDATSVEPSTVRFGPAGATAAHGGHAEDVNGDGLADLVLHFRTQQTGITAGQTQACLTGTALDGTDIEGCDAIRTLSK